MLLAVVHRASKHHRDGGSQQVGGVAASNQQGVVGQEPLVGDHPQAGLSMIIQPFYQYDHHLHSILGLVLSHKSVLQ